MPYTASGLARQARCLRLGDIVFLPQPAALDTHRKLGAEIRRTGLLWRSCLRRCKPCRT